MTNEGNSFSEIDTVKFVPNQCTWYTIDDSYKEILDTPGQEDLIIDITTQNSDQPLCEQFNFFNSVSRIEISHILVDGSKMISRVPETEVSLDVETPTVKISAEQL